MRPDQSIPKVAVLLTDGYSNGGAVAGPASQLRNIGVNIFSIGVGHYVNPSELNTIATDPDSTHVFRMNSFNDLAGWVDKLSAVSCDGKCIINRQRRFWATYFNRKWGQGMQKALFRSNSYPASSVFFFWLAGIAFKLGHIQTGICSITFLTRQGIKNKDMAVCVESFIFPAL